MDDKLKVEHLLASSLKGIQQARSLVDHLAPASSFAKSLEAIDLTLGARYEHWKALCAQPITKPLNHTEP